MMFRRENWGDGVEHYTIYAGNYSCGILSYGAILQSFKYKEEDIVTGFDNLHGYKTQTAHMGQVVGPIANRIKNATFSLNDKVYYLDKNNNGNSLHSGSKNFGDENWSLKSHTENSVTLFLHSEPKGGFDQTYNAEITYCLNSNGELSLDYSLQSDKDSPVNLTNHVYFNLGGGDIRESVMHFKSSAYIAVDELLIPTEIKESEGTAFDFNKPRKIIDKNNGAYDTCFILDDNSTIVVENKGLKLSMTTDLPAFQLYTGIHLSTSENGKTGKPYGNYDGFALESSYYPDFVNRPDFKGYFLKAGEIYHTRTVYKLETLV